MNDRPDVKFDIRIDDYWNYRPTDLPRPWSIGCCISHSYLGETYLFINLFRWSISIGWLCQ